MSLLKGVNCSFVEGAFKRKYSKDEKAPTKEEFFASRLWKKRFPTAEKLDEAWCHLSGEEPKKVDSPKEAKKDVVKGK